MEAWKTVGEMRGLRPSPQYARCRGSVHVLRLCRPLSQGRGSASAAQDVQPNGTNHKRVSNAGAGGGDVGEEVSTQRSCQGKGYLPVPLSPNPQPTAPSLLEKNESLFMAADHLGVALTAGLVEAPLGFFSFWSWRILEGPFMLLGPAPVLMGASSFKQLVTSSAVGPSSAV